MKQRRFCFISFFWVETSHGVTIKADLKFEDIASFEDADMLMIPGGMPGSTNLNEHEGVRQALIAQHKAGKRIGAICAAPMVLASTGILEGKKATCYPGFEQYFGENTEYTATPLRVPYQSNQSACLRRYPVYG